MARASSKHSDPHRQPDPFPMWSPAHRNGADTKDLGVPRALGKYTPGGFGQLVLVRVRGHDANGSGGALVWAPPFGAMGPITLDAASEIVLNQGAGIAVYEVFDSAPSILESAQISTFLALPRPSGGQLSVAQASAAWPAQR
jgi:hypothetical protein